MKETWYQLPEADCERLNRTEMQSVRWLLAALNSCVLAQKDLDKRLECIPEGKRRFRLMTGQLRAIANDLIGTTPTNQCRQIRNTMTDMDLRLTPKMTPVGNRVVLDVYDLSYIVQHAQKDDELCQTCIRTGDECRECKLYQIMSAIAPLEDWGSGMMCPYGSDWMGK